MRRSESARGTDGVPSATEFHVLLVLSRGALYGYAIMKAVEEESGGRVRPEIGSLYRVLSRLMAQGGSAAPARARTRRAGQGIRQLG